MKENNFTIAVYQDFLKERKLVGSRCMNCGDVSLPLKPICSHCQKDNMELIHMSGKGKLAAYSLIAIGPKMMVEEGFDKQHPYCSGIVELDEGIRIPARIIGLDVGKSVSESVGTPCKLEFLQRDNKPNVLTFKIVPNS